MADVDDIVYFTDKQDGTQEVYLKLHKENFSRADYTEHEMTNVKRSLTQYVATGESITLYSLQQYLTLFLNVVHICDRL